MSIPFDFTLPPEFELRANESVLWRGGPDPTIRFSAGDIFLIPFTIVWGGFALIWNSAVWTSSNAPLGFRIFGLPFLVVGTYISIGRFFISASRKRRTQYLVTSERAVIFDDRGRQRYVDLANVLHETRQLRNNRGISVTFRSPMAAPVSYFNGGGVDPRLTGLPVSNIAQTPNAFVFQGVSDASGLLEALKIAPSAH